MPQFKLTQKVSNDLAAYIRDSAKGQAVEGGRKIQGDVELGKKQFVSIGCVNCHEVDQLKSDRVQNRVVRQFRPWMPI